MRALVVGWLLLQILVPFCLKFDVPNFRYRNQHFSWGMYGSLKQDYSVSLFMNDGQAIPDIRTFVASYSSPGWMLNPDGRMSPEQIERRLAQLVRRIAESRGGANRYSAVVIWRYPVRPTWRFTWPAG